MFCEPDESFPGLVYRDRFGREAFVARARSVYQHTTGAVLAPMSAFLLLQNRDGRATHGASCRERARGRAFLRDRSSCRCVDYVGFPDSPYHALAHKYLAGGRPRFTFGVTGGFEGGKAFYNALKLVKQLVNIGDTRSLYCHPASNSPANDPEERLRAGIGAETIQLSVGIEHAQDIIGDLDQALLRAASWVS